MNTATQEPHFDQNRSDAIERLLSDTVEATTIGRPIRRTALIGITSAVVAFALAGALTGAAVASSSTGNTARIAGEAAAKGAAEQQIIHQQNGTILGKPVVHTGTYAAIELKDRPKNANWVVIGITCLSTGAFTTEDSIGSRTITNCTQSQVGTAGAESGTESFLGKLNPVVIVSSKTGVRFSVWVSWAHAPSPGRLP